MANIIDLIGNTPMVEIKGFHDNPKVKIYAKLEGNNPGGSVKDRAALNMIRSAMERGEINKETKYSDTSDQKAFLEYLFCMVVFYIAIFNFLG